MPRRGARVLSVSAAQATSGTSLLGGPLRLTGWSFTAGAAQQSIPMRGTQNAPAAGTTIASVSLPNGRYTINWFIELTGTPGAADIDNVALFIGATQLTTSDNAGAVGQYDQLQLDVVVTGGPLILAAKAIGNAAVGSVYLVNADIIPLDDAAATILDGAAKQVGFIAAGQGGADTQQLGEGVDIETAISVLSTVSTISGVLYYYLPEDIEHYKHSSD